MKRGRWALPEVSVALAGSPNVGKSTLFNRLTGLRQHTGNWAGKTVASAEGVCESAKRRYRLVDLPGTYSLHTASPEEALARDYLASGEAQAVVVVCDASCLERNLGLVLQILALTHRVLVCVNLLDEAARRGITLDLPLLQERLGVPVIGLVAREKRSRAALLAALDALLDAPAPETVFQPELPEGGEDAGSAARMLAAAALCEGVVRRHPGGADWDRRLDRLLTGRALGYPLMLALLAFIFYLTIRGANVLSDALQALFSVLELRLAALLDALAASPPLRGLLLDGAWRVLSWVVAVMLPPMAVFFPLFTLLEDLGYLPRVAYNLDRPFQRCHACGKQALTMCMGLGCNAAGVIGCRIIDSERERLLAILTNSLVPCNGRFPMLLTLLSLFFAASGAPPGAAALGLTGVIVFSVGMSFLATRLLSATVLRGSPSAFVLELPPYRRPQLGQILLRSLLDRTLFVLGRAALVAAPAGMLLWLLANLAPGGVSLIARCAAALDPIGRFLGLDGAILLAFVLGLPANETVLPILLMIYTAQGTLAPVGESAALRALLLQNGWSGVTVLCVLIFCVLHWPCSTTLLTIRRETGRWRWALLAAALPTALGLALCALIAQLSRLL